MNYSFVLSGWEGSAADSRVLRDAVTRPNGGGEAQEAQPDPDYVDQVQTSQTDPNAKTMRYKSWPLFKDWSEIFGKDRTTGENAQVFADVVQEVASGGQSAGTPLNPQNFRHEQTPTIPISETAVGDTNSACRGESSSTKKNRNSKKRRPDDELEGRFIQVMKAFCEETNRQLGQLAERIGFDQDESKKRQAVFDALKDIDFLTVEDKLKVAKQLCNNNKDLDLFFSLSDDLKPVMVKMTIKGRL
ncbi:hypothetical protein DH2020_013139 [Rehmannia glutinosa]|uniref:Uncharacterized protein n=1 Tax=Rehmannia glutinosa TaxID=99300 RepID=A0ABR0X233_REHGL